MVSSDLEVLLDMGFDQQRAELAIKNTGGIQGAIDWLEKNQDKPLEEITKTSEADQTVESKLEKNQDKPSEENAKTPEADHAVESASQASAGEARSLICNECGKGFRTKEQAEFHATKSGHVDFAESTVEIAPLTEAEKKAKLEELRQRLAQKRSGASEKDKLDQKRNEEIRRKSTKETQDLKEDLQKKELLKEAAAKRREKQEEIAAKEKIRAKIAADKEERRARAEREKAKRAGLASPLQPEVVIASSAAQSPASKPGAAYTDSRLRLQTSGGSVQKSFPVQTTLFEVASALGKDSGIEVHSFTQNFPKRVFSIEDFGSTLKELGLVPSAVLIVG